MIEGLGMKVYIVVANWNGADLLPECLESLKKQSIKAEIIVVDNGSTDNSVKLIRSNFPEVILLQNTKNLGFTGGVNTGIKYALEHDADAIALFNNDAVAKKTWLEELCKKMDKNTGIVTCKLMQSDKKHFDSTGDYYTTWGIPFPRGRNQLDKGQYDKPEKAAGASGGASLYSAPMLKEIGIFDQKFFAYYEDVDISLRAQFAGWGIVYQPTSIAYHHIGGTSSKMGDFTRYHSIKNFLILYTKDMPARLYWKYLPNFLYQFSRTTARSFIDLKPHVWLRSILMFLVLLPSILIDRYKIQKNRKISSSEVERIIHIGRPPKIPSL